MNPIWSICIPTYNRADCLQMNLENIFSQMDGLAKKEIEILVSNNCSTDNTDAIVKSFLNRGENISYYVNKENIGPDRNFLQCINKAHGKYVLLLGDDDYLLNGTIPKLLAVLKQDDYGVVYIANKMIMFSRNIPINDSENYKIKANTYNDSNLFLKKVSFFITFMSGSIFNKKYLERIDYYNKYIGSYLIQITFFIHAIFKAQNNMYIKSPVLASKKNDNGGYKITDVFCVSLNKLLNEFKQIGVTDATISSINDDVIIKFLPYFIAKIRNERTRFQDDDMEKVLNSVYSNNLKYYIFLYPILLLPPSIAKIYSYFPRLYGKLLKMLS